MRIGVSTVTGRSSGSVGKENVTDKLCRTVNATLRSPETVGRVGKIWPDSGNGMVILEWEVDATGWFSLASGVELVVKDVLRRFSLKWNTETGWPYTLMFCTSLIAIVVGVRPWV